MIRLKITDIIIITGDRGTGKSTAAMNFARQFPRLAIFDPLDEYRFKGFDNIYVPGSEDAEEFDMMCKNVWELGENVGLGLYESSDSIMSNVMIVCDEAETYMPEGPKLLPNVFKVVMQGRHRNIGMILTTKRIAEMKKTVVSQAKYVLIFRHFLDNDIKYIRQFAGDRAEEVRGLKDHRFFLYDNSGGENTNKFTGPWIMNLTGTGMVKE